MWYCRSDSGNFREQSLCEVDLAFDGESGLDYILTGLCDLILLDIMLPKVDGVTILKRVRHLGMEVPIIFLTAKSQLEDRGRWSRFRS